MNRTPGTGPSLVSKVEIRIGWLPRVPNLLTTLLHHCIYERTRSSAQSGALQLLLRCSASTGHVARPSTRQC